MHRSIAAALAYVVGCALLTFGLTSLPAAAAEEEEVHPEWGSTSAPNAVLRRGCKKYEYSYDITPPPGNWMLEIRIKGPSGKRVAAGVWMDPDPLRATIPYRLCKATTRRGRFTIRAYLSVQNNDEMVEGWLPESHFRLHRPRR